MTYLSDAIPEPQPTIDDRAFWNFCNQRQLRFQRCSDCSRFRAPPTPTCPHCQSDRLEWIEARDEAQLFSYTVVHYSAHPGVSASVPYNVAIVLFPSFDNVRLVSNVVGIPNEELKIGMRLRLVWETKGGGFVLPRFAPKG
jgi:uncharacterized OB-fold protein